MSTIEGAVPQGRLPRLNTGTKINHSPHLVILGAGASRACCPSGDKNGLKLPLMNDFVGTVGVGDLIRKGGYDPSGNFEAIYSQVHRDGDAVLLANLDKDVRHYFSQLVIPDKPTLYDYLLLALRPKDIVITFNWDPLLPQAYRRWRHLGAVLPELVFLHGNVDLGVDLNNKVFGFMVDEPYPGRTLSPTKLLYPVEKKNYNDDIFVSEQWKKTADYLEEAYFITVYGYSAPVTDVEARSLLLKAWRANRTRELAEIEIVDVRSKEEVEASWSDFLVDVHGGASTNFDHNILMRHPRRSCESFAFSTLQQSPWREDPFPTECSLEHLQKWVGPLIEEEKRGHLSGKPLH